MTISPPSNVNNNIDTDTNIKILASGIDSLVIAIDVIWHDQSLFEYLEKLKQEAKENNQESTGAIGAKKYMKWYFNMYPSGVKGWEWYLKSQEFNLLIGNWLTPISRPSVMVDIRSETLWRVGTKESVEWIIALIASVGGEIISAKPSRVDVCVDILMPESLWTEDLRSYRVTRARMFHPYYDNEKLTGMMIGKGAISARIYDKEYEIDTHSGKYWMYDIWDLEKVPENMKVIRIEFQVRREVLKQLAIESRNDLFSFIDALWAYCTKNWLKFQDNPGKHHTQRTTYKWWEDIQNGFMGVQGACPLIRAKAIKIDSDRLKNQALGYFTSLMASEAVGMGLDTCKEDIDYREELLSLIINPEWLGKNNNDFNEEVKRKIAKYYRGMGKLNEAREKREEEGFPTG